MAQKVWMYIDGPNFYYSLPRKHIALGWCDFRKLAEQHLLDEDSELERIKYFTSPVEDLGHPSEEFRQNVWLDAVRTINGLQIITGFYSGREPYERREKQTDVNIAIKLVFDAFQSDSYDTAILVSGDTDLAPAVLAVQKDIPGGKKVHVCVPLDEPSAYWERLGYTEDIIVKMITPEMLTDSRLPEKIKTKSGYINCLEKWKLGM